MKKIIFILTLGLLFTACSEDDAAPVVDPSTFYLYPLATFELENPGQQGAVFQERNDGDPAGTIVVNVSMDKAIAYLSFFTAVEDTLTPGIANVGEDYVVNDLTIPAYNTTGQLSIVVLSDNFPEPDETVSLIVKPLSGSDGEQYDKLFDPATEYLHLNFTIENAPTSNTALTMGLKWNEDQASDLDVVVFDANGNEFAIIASSANPEVGEIIPNTAPDGTYYVNIDDFAVEAPPVDYTFGFAKPNGEVVTIEGSLETDNPDQYTIDFSPSLASDTFRVVKIVKSGSTYEITSLVE